MFFISLLGSNGKLKIKLSKFFLYQALRKIKHEHKFNIAEGTTITGAPTKDDETTFFILSRCYDSECRAVQINPKKNFNLCTAKYIERIKEVLQTNELVLVE